MKSEKQLTKWQQQVKDDIAWTNSDANYIGLNPEDLWASALEARDKRIAELERGVPVYIAMLKRHLTECAIAAGVCTSCAHVQTLLLRAQALNEKDK